MRLAVTGFVSDQAGSVASANALLLRALLDRGIEVDFFSKQSFVDPRPAVGPHDGFRFIDVENRWADRIRAASADIPGLAQLTSFADAATYNRLLVRTISEHHLRRSYDLCLWLGDYAAGAVPELPTVSFAQGPPGTDARSILRRFSEIRKLAGAVTAWIWMLMARLRLTKPFLPQLQSSDRLIVGSHQSQSVLREIYGVAASKIEILPYPIGLEMFRPMPTVPSSTLRCLWLGRIIPRKRLDLFLDGAAAAIASGCDLTVSVVGGIGFLPGYEKLIAAFPYPEKITWIPALPRDEVPGLMAAHDLLVQPSEEENFGSSVAEAQACGLPVIVGATNGNADYLCPRDIHLSDYAVATLADALREMTARKQEGRLGSPSDSRRLAETHFSLEKVASRLEKILGATISPT